MAKKKLNPKDKEALMPAVKEFNGIAKTLIKLLGMQVEQKEKKVSILISRIKKPSDKEKHVDVTSVDISSDFLKKQRQKNRSKDDGEWDEYFSSKKGWVI